MPYEGRPVQKMKNFGTPHGMSFSANLVIAGELELLFILFFIFPLAIQTARQLLKMLKIIQYRTVKYLTFVKVKIYHYI